MKTGCLLLFLLSAYAHAQDKKITESCEACRLMYEGMPATLLPKTKIIRAAEPGEKMRVSGIIYKRDGRTPAKDVILYIYHTDAGGLYSPDPAQTYARRHGHLRGWMKTGADGRYEFTTIRPAAYPGRQIPAHIHPLIKEDGRDEYWIDEYLFEDDPLLTQKERDHQMKRGGNGIISLKKDSEGVWVGRRDIILGLNVPGY